MSANVAPKSASEQLTGGLLDGRPGLTALGGQSGVVSGALASRPDPVTGAQQSTGQVMADNRFRDFGCGDGGLQVDIDVDVAVAQQVHQVLGGDVAGGAWCEWQPPSPPTDASSRRLRS